MKMMSNSGHPKSPSPKMVMVHKGIQGLLSSGPGMTKTVDHAKLRPEKNEGAKIPQGAMKKMPTMTAVKSSMPMKKAGSVKIMSHIRPEGTIKRDSAKTIKS
jgi:hypothetical protein